MRPPQTLGLRHVALFSSNLDAALRFYSELLGLKVVWQPDADNIYLSSGSDNLALHRAPADFVMGESQRLDHLGFFLKEREDVDRWHSYLAELGVKISKTPKEHRDGTRSFYCMDPDGNSVQMIFVPGINT